MQQSVQRHQHLYTIGMSIIHYLSQVLYAVSCRLARTIRRRTDIHSICTGLDSRFRYFFVASRREEAKRYITMPAVTDTFIECFVPY